MATFNFSGLQQKADQVLHNADEAVRKWVDLTLAPAKDVPIEYYDKNGNLVQTTVPNRAKLFNDLLVNVNSAMGKTFYVDATNGSDLNDGSQTAPFQTYETAIEKAPNGSRVTIHFLSDVSTVRDVDGGFKHIVLELNGHTFTIKDYVGGTTKQVYGITGICQVDISGSNQSTSKILFDTTVDSSKPLDANYGAFLRGFYDTYKPIGLSLGYSVTVDRSLNTEMSLLSVVNGASRFTVGNASLTSGNWSDMIKGLVRDANGVPRNIMSNLIL